MKMTIDDFRTLSGRLDEHREKIKDYRLHCIKTKTPFVTFLANIYWHVTKRDEAELMRQLYKYLNDDHITTAVKRYATQNNLTY